MNFTQIKTLNALQEEVPKLKAQIEQLTERLNKLETKPKRGRPRKNAN